MKSICCECNKVLNEGDESKGVSHGLCPECLINAIVVCIHGDVEKVKELPAFSLHHRSKQAIDEALKRIKSYKKEVVKVDNS